MESDWKPAPSWGKETFSYFADPTPHPLVPTSGITVGYMRSTELRAWMAEIRPFMKEESPNLVPDGAFLNQLIAHSLGEEIDWETADSWETTQRLWSLLDWDGLTSFYPALSQYEITEEQFYLLFETVNYISQEAEKTFYDFSPFTRYVDVVDQLFMNPLFSSKDVVSRLVEHLTKDLTNPNKLALALLLYSATVPFKDMEVIRDSLPADLAEEVTKLSDTFDRRWLDAHKKGSFTSTAKVSMFIMRSNPDHPSVRELHELINATEVPDSGESGTREDLQALLLFASAKPEGNYYLGEEFQARVRSNLGRLGYNWVNSSNLAWRMNVEPAILPYVPVFEARMKELEIDPEILPAEWVQELFA